MSMNAIMGAAASGLRTAQTGLATVSDNVANVGTVGYTRKIVDQKSLVSGGQGVGVGVAQIRLASDRFLAQASLFAASDAGKAGAASGLWDQAQSLFGDPTESTSYFSAMDQVFSAFSTLAAAPTSSAARAAALDKTDAFFQASQTIADQIQALRDQADAQISAGVTRVNTLLERIDSLNASISRAKILSGDSTGLENEQNQLINELSGLMDVRVSPRTQGGVTIRASDGFSLAGDGHATLSYERTGASGEIWVTQDSGQKQLMGSRISSGALGGLLELRNKELPDLTARLGELTAQAADTLNRIHNQYSPVPAPAALTGRQTGQTAATAFAGFTGKTTVALLDASGVIQSRIDIDFDAGTLSADGGVTNTPFTAATFASVLDTAMAPQGGASFTNGVLSLTGAGGLGVAVQDDAASPASKAGQGFSSFFGLNDLVASTSVASYDTGLTGTSPHGFTAGGEITFRMSAADGSRLADVKVTVPGGDMNALLAALNSPVSGVGAYGSFSLDANGQLAFAATPGSGRTLSVVADTSTRPVGGASVSTFFGIGDLTRGQRAGSYSVRKDIDQDPSHLSLAKLNLSAPAGTPALSVGDTRGADALALAGQQVAQFDIAGSAGAMSQKLSDYAAGLSGHIARKAEAAESAKTTADSVAAEADARRASVEGVNLDQELIQLTSYQQAYNASARMIQAVNELYEVLLNMTN